MTHKVVSENPVPEETQLTQKTNSENPVPLKVLDESIFNTTDNLVVWVFENPPSDEDLRKVQAWLPQTWSHLNPYYGLRHQAMANVEIGPHEFCHLLCLKGLRRTNFPVSPSGLEDAQIQAASQFFEPLCEEDIDNEDEIIPSLCRQDFPLLGSKTRILQYFETQCFMCFLMRPFMNSIQQLLPSLEFYRYDVHKNDFPEGLPISRGTPFFMEFPPDSPTPQVWNDYRPREILNRLQRDHGFAGDVEGLLASATQRFQVFQEVTFLKQELQMLSSLLWTGQPAPEDASIVEDLMASDMARKDNLAGNLRYWEAQVDTLEGDLLYYADLMLGHLD